MTLTGINPTGDPLIYKITSLPAHGTLYDGVGTSGHLISASDLPSYTLNNYLHMVTYRPDAGYYGSDGFNFKVNNVLIPSQRLSLLISGLLIQPGCAERKLRNVKKYYPQSAYAWSAG